MTKAQAKELVLSSLRYRFEVTLIGDRFFLAVKQGKLFTLCDGFYFHTRPEAEGFAVEMNKLVDSGELFLT